MKTSTQARDRAQQLAKSDTAAALDVAKEIDDPWSRAQALAWVGRFAEGSAYKKILASARRASSEAEDPFAAVGSAAWWLRALIERGSPKDALDALPAILDASQRIANPVSRLDALYLVFQAVFDVDSARRRVLDALLAACASAESWKASRCRSEVAVMLHSRHPEEAERVIAAMPDGKEKLRALRNTASDSGQVAPRPFFW